MSKIISFCLAGIGVFLLVSEVVQTSAAGLDRQTLASYRGGVLKYCIGTFIDPNGQNCDACLQNGNNGFVKCANTQRDMAWMNVPGQSPAQVWDESTTNCGGAISTYGAMDVACTTPTSTDPNGCLRQYTKMTFLYYDSGVNCS